MTFVQLAQSVRGRYQFDPEFKQEYIDSAKEVFKSLADHMKLDRKKIWNGSGGIAVLPEVHLMGSKGGHSFHLFVSALPHALCFRTIRNFDDYCGGNNNWIDIDCMNNPYKIANEIEKFLSLQGLQGNTQEELCQ